MFTMIKASLFIACVIAVLEAVKPAAAEAGYVDHWGLTEYPAFMRRPAEDMTEWLRKPVFVEVLGDEVDYWDYDADEDWVSHPEIEIEGYIEVDTAVVESLDGYQILDEDGHWDRHQKPINNGFDRDRERHEAVSAHLDSLDFERQLATWEARIRYHAWGNKLMSEV